MFGNLFNVEKLTYDTIQETLLNVCEELECSYSDVFIRIKPTNEECDMEFHVMQVVEGRAKKIRDITLKEILSSS